MSDGKDGTDCVRWHKCVIRCKMLILPCYIELILPHLIKLYTVYIYKYMMISHVAVLIPLFIVGFYFYKQE
jgi:hypothetical protein